MEFRDELELQILLYGEDEALDYITIGMLKQDNIECCVCLNYHWGVKLPNCDHYICPKCYYRIYNGYISSIFHDENPQPKRPDKPIYPYENQDKNKEIFYTITNNELHLEWFIHDNEDLNNLVKMNSEYVVNLDVNLKTWFENNELIKIYENDLIQYENSLEQYYLDMDDYNENCEEEKNNNAKQLCPLCRL